MECQHRGLNWLRVFKWEAMIFGQRKMVYSFCKSIKLSELLLLQSSELKGLLILECVLCYAINT